MFPNTRGLPCSTRPTAFLSRVRRGLHAMDVPPPTPDIVPLPPSPHPVPPSPATPPEINEPPLPGSEPVRDPVVPGDMGFAPVSPQPPRPWPPMPARKLHR